MGSEMCIRDRWFTLAVPPEHDLATIAGYMARKTGALEQRLMPTKRFFKIGVNFDMVKKKGSSFNFSPDNINAEKSGGETAADKEFAETWNQAIPVTDFEKEAIRQMQEDLALVPLPFDNLAKNLSISTEDLFTMVKDFQDRRIMRRYSAVLHHRRSGFRANAMIVWKVPEERSEEVGLTMAAHNAVTHCYERPTFPDWPYTHFTMVHATTPEGCEEINTEISEATGITERLVLYSTREYKKTRVRYFVPDYDDYLEIEKPDAVTTA